jgi:hypothetical protein
MATASDDVTDLQTCPICLEILKTPKNLPCLHTFCEKCIGAYITSLFERDTNQSTECPVCKSVFVIPEGLCADDWARQLPDNFFLLSLIENTNIESANNICMSCQRFEEESEALFVCVDCVDTLCKNCYLCHRSNRMSKDHDIVSVEDFNAIDRNKLKLKSYCSEHKDENIKFYCLDHEEPCCSICISIRHRKCDEVQTIQDASKGFSQSESVKSLQTFMSHVSRNVDTVLLKIDEEMADLNSQNATALSKIEKMSKDMAEKVGKLEDRLRSRLGKLVEVNKDELERKKTACGNLKKQIDNETRLLDTCIEKASDAQLMIEAKRIEDKIRSYDKCFEDQDIYETFHVKLEVINSVEELFPQIEESCQIVSTTSDSLYSLEHLHYKKTFKLVKTLTFDEEHYEACFTNNSKRIVTSCISGNCLEMFNFNGQKLQTLKLQSLPFDIAEVSEDVVAVLFQDLEVVQYINVTNENIVQTVGVKGDSISININKNKLIVAGPADVTTYDKSGQVISTINSGIKQNTYISCYKLFLYHADDENSLICKTTSGEECFRFLHADVRGINGIACDKMGNIYVTGQTSNNVVQIKKDGSGHTILLSEDDGIQSPGYIDVSNDGKHIIICQKDWKEIRLFELK